MNTEPEIFVGLDVSKDALDIAVHESGEAFRVANTTAGLSSLVTRLKKLKPSLIVLDATGGFELLAVAELSRAGLPVVVSNASRIRQFARATGQLAKTDRLDARVLAHFAAVVRPPARRLPDEAEEQLTALLTRRNQMVEMLTVEKNRLVTVRTKMRSNIEGHIQWLNQSLKDLDQEIGEAVKGSPMWREKDALLQSVPGVGPITSATMLGMLP